MGIAVEVKDLTKRYGDLVAVNKVNFTIEQGEVFGLLGPNGAGKTTTIEMIEGLRKPDEGSVEDLVRMDYGWQELRHIIAVEDRLVRRYTKLESMYLIDISDSGQVFHSLAGLS